MIVRYDALARFALPGLEHRAAAGDPLPVPWAAP
jgi:hypothetical protein